LPQQWGASLVMRWLLSILMLLLLAACIPRAVERRPAETQRPAPSPAIAGTGHDHPETRQCIADLEREGIGFRALPDRTFDGGCTALGAVQLLDIGTPTNGLTAMTCPLALQYARWVRVSLQPAAQQWLGSQVRRIESWGTYSCRPVNNVAGGRLSEHGRANAVDIAAFVLADGRRITVLNDWTSADPQIRGFLAVHQAGCRHFRGGIGPDGDAAHRDHFHFEMGQWQFCR
jgi:hypothetical protein